MANGAWLVTPQWITASLDAGEWLPARQFPVGERFRAAAERSRSAREHGATLLAGQRLYIHARTGSGTARPRKSDASVERREGGAASAADLGSLRRLAGALGAEVRGPEGCYDPVVAAHVTFARGDGVLHGGVRDDQGSGPLKSAVGRLYVHGRVGDHA